MHEVEVKAVLRDKEKVLELLENLGSVFSPPTTEEDVLYALEVGSHDAYSKNANFLRIRERGEGKVIFTLKHHPNRHEGRPDSMPLEYETEIASKEAMSNILLLQGYQEAVRIRKTRQKGTYKKWEICIDEVDGLGSFIELEELTDGKDTQKVIDEMLAFLSSLGILSEDMFADRYDIALLKQRFS